MISWYHDNIFFWTKYFFFLWYDDVYRAEGHRAVDISVKPSWKKLYLKILMRETCLGFFNIENFYRSCNYGLFWWIFWNIKPIYCAYQNLCMTFTNILGFLLHISTSWKSCVKEQWPKKSLFWHFWLNVPEIMIDDWVNKGHTNFNMFSVVGEQIRSLGCKQSKLNFWNQLHPKFAFLWHFWTQTATWRPNHTVLTSNVKAILKAMIDTFFLGPSLGGVRIFY